jgi:hypothetical protein
MRRRPAGPAGRRRAGPGGGGVHGRRAAAGGRDGGPAGRRRCPGPGGRWRGAGSGATGAGAGGPCHRVAVRRTARGWVWSSGGACAHVRGPPLGARGAAGGGAGAGADAGGGSGAGRRDAPPRGGGACGGSRAVDHRRLAGPSARRGRARLRGRGGSRGPGGPDEGGPDGPLGRRRARRPPPDPRRTAADLDAAGNSIALWPGRVLRVRAWRGRFLEACPSGWTIRSRWSACIRPSAALSSDVARIRELSRPCRPRRCIASSTSAAAWRSGTSSTRSRRTSWRCRRGTTRRSE